MQTAEDKQKTSLHPKTYMNNLARIMCFFTMYYIVQIETMGKKNSVQVHSCTVLKTKQNKSKTNLHVDLSYLDNLASPEYFISSYSILSFS